jgi:hypothetical protein
LPVNAESFVDLYAKFKPEFVCAYCQNKKKKTDRHCHICERCVKVKIIQQYDHHCKWLNNCIGKGNIKYFIGFLIFFLIGLIETITYGIYMTQSEKDKSLLPGIKSRDMQIMSFLLLAIDIPILPFITTLFYHCCKTKCSEWKESRMIDRGISRVEYEKKEFDTEMLAVKDSEEFIPTLSTDICIAPQISKEKIEKKFMCFKDC